MNGKISKIAYEQILKLAEPEHVEEFLHYFYMETLKGSIIEIYNACEDLDCADGLALGFLARVSVNEMLNADDEKFIRSFRRRVRNIIIKERGL